MSCWSHSRVHEASRGVVPPSAAGLCGWLWGRADAVPDKVLRGMLAMLELTIAIGLLIMILASSVQALGSASLRASGTRRADFRHPCPDRSHPRDVRGGLRLSVRLRFPCPVRAVLSWRPNPSFRGPWSSP